ncbi:hypothetical protein LZ30DRAFT_204607 [Colletotrichum cereale]|nr:hypothetical protein LZ30DRAFT_204607 [Colletotrichum cereale]
MPSDGNEDIIVASDLGDAHPQHHFTLIPTAKSFCSAQSLGSVGSISNPIIAFKIPSVGPAKSAFRIWIYNIRVYRQVRLCTPTPASHLLATRIPPLALLKHMLFLVHGDKLLIVGTEWCADSSGRGTYQPMHHNHDSGLQRSGAVKFVQHRLN